MHLKIAIPITIVLAAVGVAFCYPNVISLVRFAVGGILKGKMNTSADGREMRCLEYVKKHAIQGNATDVLLKIDTFGWSEDFLMNVGDAKGAILTAEVKKKSPRYALEVGAYVGYSATRIASDLVPGGRLTSVEFSAENAAIARAMVDYAGLSDRVEIVVGTVSSVLKEYAQRAGIPAFDFLFIDHEKSAYLSDLKYMLEEELIAKGAVVVGDNILFPGAPEYRKFVNSDPRFRTVEHTSHVEYLPIADIVTVSDFLGSP